MPEMLRMILEIGKKERRVVAGATDWPGLDRWGRTDEDAIATLTSYRPRYAAVAERAGLADAFALQREPEIVERVTGSSSADYSPDGRAAHREATLDAIRAYNADGRIAGRSWPIQFLVRRIAHHVMDHAWELEDRDTR